VEWAAEIELTVEAAMTGGQMLPAALDLTPQAQRSFELDSRCARRATRSRRRTSNSTWPRKAAR
jgi:hypothetical protein